MEHLHVAFYETPSMDVLLKFLMEPEIMIWNGYNETELLPAMTVEEAMKPMKRTKHNPSFLVPIRLSKSSHGCLHSTIYEHA
jgi:hypothetical protein